jgi:4-amino-4-deoxy-L-arabinose transferase-like glycosyltransferase
MINRNHRSWELLILIIIASFTVRLAALAYWQTGAIDNEGAEYARIAENLRNGIGFVGIAMPGTELLFNPLFPALTAAASFVTHDYEWAARVVSLLLGGLLPLPVFGIATRLFSRRIGLVAALLTVLHPLLVNLSFATYSEGPYMTLLLSATYVVVRALNHSSTGAWLLVGTMFGLAYLLRAEAAAAFLIAVMFALTATGGGAAVRCKRAGAATAIFLLLALPEIILIYKSTGRVMLEGKSTLQFDLGTRILSAEKSLEVHRQLPDGHEPYSAQTAVWGREGVIKGSAAYNWAHFALDPHLRGTGTTMRTNAEVIREARITPKEAFRLVEEAVRHKAPVVVNNVFLSSWLGPPFLPALALLGALRRPWRRPQASSRLFVMLVPVAPIAASFSNFWDEPRYYFVLLPFLLIWASNGLIEVGLWTKASSAAVGWKLVARPVLSRCIIPGLIGLSIIIYPVKPARAFFTPGFSSRIEKDVGLWIKRQQDHPVRIMDLAYGLVLAFHANAQHVQFPYCDGALALRFLDSAEVDYVILRRGGDFTQYYEDWLRRGIPDPRAEPVHVSPDADNKYVVYRWRRPR